MQQSFGWYPELQRGAWLLQVLAGVAGELGFDELHQLHQQVSSPAIGGRVLPTQVQWRALLGDNAQGLHGIEPDLFASHALYLLPDATQCRAECWLPWFQWGQDDASGYTKLLESRLNRLARLHLDRPASAPNLNDPWIEALLPLAKIKTEDTAWLRDLCTTRTNCQSTRLSGTQPAEFTQM
ncbi:MAG: hypothetical protein QM520_01465 [Gammaproteobacteria bacterium]|nr:hypothetical protein [Gammaproteobacteria bacterium]